MADERKVTGPDEDELLGLNEDSSLGLTEADENGEAKAESKSRGEEDDGSDPAADDSVSVTHFQSVYSFPNQSIRHRSTGSEVVVEIGGKNCDPDVCSSYFMP